MPVLESATEDATVIENTNKLEAWSSHLSIPDAPVT